MQNHQKRYHRLNKYLNNVKGIVDKIVDGYALC